MRISIVAGESGTKGLRDGQSLRSLFHHPRGLCLDRDGNLLVADTSNHRIRKVDVGNGIVTTIAGCGQGFEDGDAMKAKFRDPCHLVVRGHIIYVSDRLNGAIRRIEDGIVSTIATGFAYPEGIAIDGSGNILVANSGDNSVRRIDAVHGLAFTFPSPVVDPIGVATSPDGTIYISTVHGDIVRSHEGGWIRVIRTNHTIHGLSVHPSGDVVFTEMNCVRRIRFGKEGSHLFAVSNTNAGDSDGSITESHSIPSDVTIDGSFVYISDVFDHTIRRIFIGSWNRGGCIDSFPLNNSFRESSLVSCVDEEGDTHIHGTTIERKREGESSEQVTKRHSIPHFSIPNEGSNLRMNSKGWKLFPSKNGNKFHRITICFEFFKNVENLI